MIFFLLYNAHECDHSLYIPILQTKILNKKKVIWQIDVI